MLNTCEEPPRDKVREGLVGVLALEAGGTLVLKLMLDTLMYVEDWAFVH